MRMIPSVWSWNTDIRLVVFYMGIISRLRKCISSFQRKTIRAWAESVNEHFLKRFPVPWHITRNQQSPFLQQSLRFQLNSKRAFSYARDIFRFVVLVIPFRWFVWTEKRTPSLVTVNVQRVSPDNGCTCAIVILPDLLGCLMHDRSNETWLRQLIPVNIYCLTKQMVGTPEFWPFVETEDGIFCYEDRSIMSSVKIEWVQLEFTQSRKTPKSNRGRAIRVRLVLLYDDIRQEKERPIKLLAAE